MAEKANIKGALKTEVAVIGTGFAGICMGIQLKKAGITDFIILERADDIGGTWRDNTYPGAACDVSSHMYSFSFEPKPDWSRMYSPQQEIQEYLWHCTHKYSLEPYIRFNSNVVGSFFNEETGYWTIKVENGHDIIAKFIVNGMGPLNRAIIPSIKGQETFTGTSFHSSHWDHQYDINDKKIAVIGTGASAIQIVPSIADKVKELYLYQRTAPWVLPKADREMTGIEKWLFKSLPLTQKTLRSVVYWINEATVIGIVINPSLTKWIEKVALKFLEKAVPDPVLREKVTPKYTIGCKRILLSNEYYPALSRPNVDVINDGIDRIDGNKIYTKDGSFREVDAIVYATGFQASEYPKELVVKGIGQKDLLQTWKDGPEAYLGTVVNGFPNMFLVIGPNTGLGHNSMVFMIEASVNYIVKAIKTVRNKGMRYLNVKEEIQEAYNAEIQKKLEKTVWNSGCNSWYLTSTGKNTTVWPGFTFEYWQKTRNIRPADYEWS